MLDDGEKNEVVEGEEVDVLATDNGNSSDAQIEIIPASSSSVPALPDYIPTEMFLERSGFFTPASKRIKGVYVKEKVIGHKIVEGKRVPVKTKIMANHELGLPITSDEDYWHAFEKILSEIADREGRITMPVRVPTAKLLRYARKNPSQTRRTEVSKWFQRMTLTGITGGIYSAKIKDYITSITAPVFSQVFLRGEPMRHGQIADTNFVWLAPWYLSNYFHQYRRLLDFSLYLRLRKPIAKALRPLLQTGWYASDGKPIKRRYSALCAEFLITPYKKLSRVKQQFDPSHKELQREKVLAHWEYQASGDDIVITYHAGSKFAEEMKERRERAELSRAIETQGKEVIPAHALEEQRAKNQLFVDDIIAVTGSQDSAQYYGGLVAHTPHQFIHRALSETRDAKRMGRIRTTPAQFFSDLIKRFKDSSGNGQNSN